MTNEHDAGNSDLFDVLDEDHGSSDPISPSKKESSIIRTPPLGDHQADFFIPKLYDVSTRDSRSVMDVAVFRLSKRGSRSNDVIRYELSDGFVKVSSGPAGMATVWDYDLVLMAVSHLTEAMNLYKRGHGQFPGRVFHPHLKDILKFCRRNRGGQQAKRLLDTLLRLNTTHVAIERKRKRGAEVYIESEGEPLISRYRVISNPDTGHPESVEIEVANWIYEEVTQGKNPDVLTVHPDYFLIEPGIGRFLYRLARRAAGSDEARYSFRTIYDRSGSSGTFKKFAYTLRRLIHDNQLPEYNLFEEHGNSGPVLVMMHRAHYAELEGLSPQEYASYLMDLGMKRSSAVQEASSYAKTLRKKKEAREASAKAKQGS